MKKQIPRYARNDTRLTGQVFGSVLANAKLSAVALFENGNNLFGELVDLAFGQGGFAALECNPYEQGVFSGGDIFPAEQIDGFRGSDLRNVE